MSDAVLGPAALPVGSVDHRGSGWWGMITLILTEAALFAYLLFSYYYFAAQYGRSWLPSELPQFRLSGPNTVLLLLSSVAVWWGERGAKRGALLQLLAGTGVGFLLGAAFVAIQVLEWLSKKFTLATSSYGSLYFTITGFHMAHVVAGLMALAAIFVWSVFRYFDSARHAPVSISAVYWHFVDFVWLTVFFTFYVTPHLG